MALRIAHNTIQDRKAIFSEDSGTEGSELRGKESPSLLPSATGLSDTVWYPICLSIYLPTHLSAVVSNTWANHLPGGPGGRDVNPRSARCCCGTERRQKTWLARAAQEDAHLSRGGRRGGRDKTNLSKAWSEKPTSSRKTSVPTTSQWPFPPQISMDESTDEGRALIRPLSQSPSSELSMGD